MHIGETRRFDKVHQMGTYTFRVVAVAPDGVRTEPVPNTAKPPSAAYTWWHAESWIKGTLVNQQSAAPQHLS